MLSVIAVAERRRILTVLRVHHNRGEGTSIERGPDPPHAHHSMVVVANHR